MRIPNDQRGGGGSERAGEAFCVRGNSDKWNSDESGKRRRGKGGATKVLRGQKPTLTHMLNASKEPCNE